MTAVFRFWSVISNPLFIPLYALLVFYAAIGRYVMESRTAGILLVLFVFFTVLIPLLVYLLLKGMGIVKSIHLKDVSERRTPLLAYCVLILALIRITYDTGYMYELYFFLLGACMASFTAFVLSYMKYKISLHMIGMGGLTAATVLIMISYGISPIIWCVGLLIASGFTGSARLSVNAHKGHELILGYALGLSSQLVLLPQYL